MMRNQTYSALTVIEQYQQRETLQKKLISTETEIKKQMLDVTSIAIKQQARLKEMEGRLRAQLKHLEPVLMRHLDSIPTKEFWISSKLCYSEQYSILLFYYNKNKNI